jgi:hypothetical protein
VLPILILCFARIDTLKRTLNSILTQPHGAIYVSCDGPSPAYARGCEEVREYISELLRTGVIHGLRISEINEGTLIGVSKGIDWFFDQEEIGIIIEDDLVLESSLLEVVEISSGYLSNSDIISIGLHNGTPTKFISDNTKMSRRSNFVISWGWVTTREKWNSRISSFRDVDFWRLFKIMTRAIGPSSAAYHLWIYALQRKQERIDVRKCDWDHLWQLNCFLNGKSVATFNRNLITNIGDGEGATHTFGKSLYVEIVPITEVDFRSVDFWNLPQDIDYLADKYFVRDRKISTIIRGTLRIRTRLGLR